MKKVLTTLPALLFLATISFADDGVERKEDMEAIRATIQHYFNGHATGDKDEFRKAFHPEAKLFWIKDGAFTQRPSQEWIDGMKGGAPVDEAKRKRSIESIDIAGHAAVVRIRLDYPAADIVDFMSMLKIEGEWKIVNKIFHTSPKVAVKK